MQGWHVVLQEVKRKLQNVNQNALPGSYCSLVNSVTSVKIDRLWSTCVYIYVAWNMENTLKTSVVILGSIQTSQD